jgi:hypothetical protein
MGHFKNICRAVFDTILTGIASIRIDIDQIYFIVS